MNVEFLLLGRFQNRRIPPNRDKVFSAVISCLDDVKLNPILFYSEHSIIDGGTLLYSFHPSADPIYFDFQGDVISISINTGALGAGYHKFLMSILDRLSRRLDVVFTESESHIDQSLYFTNRDFLELQNFFMLSLVNYSENLLHHHEEGFSNFMLAMPYDYPIIEKEYFALSSLGYWGKSWFIEFINSEQNIKDKYARDFFIWHNEHIDASFWFKSAISMIWLYFPFRPIIDETERRILKKINYSLEQAYALDNTLSYPWDIWQDVANYLQDDSLLAKLKTMRPERIHNQKQSIGFRTEFGRSELAGGFSIIMPMRMNRYRTDKALVEFKDPSLYAAFQVYSFEQNDTDIIMEYVIRQLDTVDEKGEELQISIKDVRFKTALYKKQIESGEYMLTLAVVASKLALLAWFTYDQQNEDMFSTCISAINSISLSN